MHAELGSDETARGYGAGARRAPRAPCGVLCHRTSCNQYNGVIASKKCPLQTGAAWRLGQR